MTRAPYRLLEETGPRLGLIVLQMDETIEDDFRKLFAVGQIRMNVSRIPSGARLNPDTIRTMEADLPAAASLLPPSATYDAVGYACTSGTTLIGAARVRELVQSGCQTKSVTDPLTATIAAIEALGLQRVGIVSPYIPSVAEELRAAFEKAGVTVPALHSFGEEIEANVARIAPDSIAAAVREMASCADVDGIFLSCTNLRTLDLIDLLETELRLPVISSNQALAWHMALISGALSELRGPGALLRV